MISAIQWIRKGVAAENPEKYVLDESEYQRISEMAASRLGDAKLDLSEAQAEAEAAAAAMDVDEDDQNNEVDALHEEDSEEEHVTEDKEGEDELAKYNLDSYDDEVAASKDKEVGIFLNQKDLTYYKDENDDPYITLDRDIDEEEEKEELKILPTDNLLVAAKTEDDISQLEIYVYEKEEDNLYVHHDIMLPAFPLCVEWLDFHSGDKAGQEGTGNYLAVGTFEPDIEIWNLDIVDAMMPQAILGYNGEKKRSKKVNDKYHVDAVMDLSWNKQHRNFLLSSSADTTVKLWDLNTGACAHSYKHHQDKVQSVSWNPVEATVFISGSYDKTVRVLDARSPEQTTCWNLQSDVESLVWDPHNPTNFFVAMEDGIVQYYDVRTAINGVGSKALFTLQAHDGAVSALDVNLHIPGCIATGSTDKQIKVWNTTDNKPSMVTSRNFDLGHIFSAQFCPDSPLDLAIAGSNGKVHIWDMSKNAGVRQVYGQAA